jgi:hypothetical protein
VRVPHRHRQGRVAQGLLQGRELTAADHEPAREVVPGIMAEWDGASSFASLTAFSKAVLCQRPSRAPHAGQGARPGHRRRPAAWAARGASRTWSAGAGGRLGSCRLGPRSSLRCSGSSRAHSARGCRSSASDGRRAHGRPVANRTRHRHRDSAAVSTVPENHFLVMRLLSGVEPKIAEWLKTQIWRRLLEAGRRGSAHRDSSWRHTRVCS